MTAMSGESRHIIIWNGLLLRPSETFVRVQAAALRRFVPHFAGVRFAGEPSLVSREQCLLVNRGGALGAARELAFKLTGTVPAMRRSLERLRPSLLHAHHGVSGTLALPLTRALGIPLVVTFHGADATTHTPSHYLSFAQWASRRRSGQFKREAALFIAVSNFIKQKLVDRGFPPESVVVHYIGVNTRDFRPDPAVPREPVILFVGRLAEKKGCEYLIRAMEQVQHAAPELSLIIVGDGPLKSELQALAAAKVRRCSFLGLQSHEQVRQWMKRASILAAPSVTAASGDSEGLPTVIIEAQAMGLPVVASDHAGIGEAIIQGETGLMAPERDVATFAGHITRLSRDPSLRSTLAVNARRQVERKFDIRSQTAALEDIYEDVLAIASRPRRTFATAGGAVF